MNCRHCQSPLTLPFIDLGFAPPSNAYLTKETLYKPELTFPLRVKVCENCWLVQTEDYASSETYFSEDYAYFSSTSSSWLAHAKAYCDMIIRKLTLNKKSQVIEIAANDGYLLKNFLEAGIPCLGIEPTASTANIARKKGIEIIGDFFSLSLANELKNNHQQADLIIGNNVFAHVPDINDFTEGLKVALKPGGTITLEFPHLLELIRHCQFDTIYHEHFSYLSLIAVSRIFATAGLRVLNVERLKTHGGSLRVYGCHDDDIRKSSNIVKTILMEEKEEGLASPLPYKNFQSRADKIKNNLLRFLLDETLLGKKVVAYGAAAKGNTLLNYAGVKPDLLPLVFDAAPSKQNKFLPGSHIPIVSPDEMEKQDPDIVLILPWNLATEIAKQWQPKLNLKTRFIVAVPEIKVL